MAITAAIAIASAIAWYFWSTAPMQPSVKIYFFKGDKLFVVSRPISAGEAPLPKAIKELLAGPSGEESYRGIVSLVPRGTRALSFKVRGKTVIVNFSRELEKYGGGSTRLQGMIAQIVYTATDVPGIEKAWIWMEGEKELVLGGEGLILDRPLGRKEVSY